MKKKINELFRVQKRDTEHELMRRVYRYKNKITKVRGKEKESINQEWNVNSSITAP